MIRAVMFDMDGVLIDSEPTHHAAMRAALRHHGLPLPDDRAWSEMFYGRPDRDGLADWLLFHHVAADIEAVMTAKLHEFETSFQLNVTVFDDGVQLARRLHEQGVPLALVSGARRVEVDLVLAHFDLEQVFAVSVSSDDIPAGKPDPQPYLRGAELLGVAASDCLVIEDAVAGVRAAEAAGASVIAIDRLNQPERFGTVRPVQHLDDGVMDDILGRLAR